MKSGCYQHKRSGVRIHSSTIIKKHLFTVKVLKDKNRTKGTENWPILKQKKSATKSSSNFVRSFEFISNFILRCFIVAPSNCCPRLYEERKRERVLVGKREEEREAERVTGERVSLCAWLKVECLRKPNCSLPIEGTHCQFEN